MLLAIQTPDYVPLCLTQLCLITVLGYVHHGQHHERTSGNQSISYGALVVCWLSVLNHLTKQRELVIDDITEIIHILLDLFLELSGSVWAPVFTKTQFTSSCQTPNGIDRLILWNLQN